MAWSQWQVYFLLTFWCLHWGCNLFERLLVGTTVVLASCPWGELPTLLRWCGCFRSYATHKVRFFCLNLRWVLQNFSLAWGHVNQCIWRRGCFVFRKRVTQVDWGLSVLWRSLLRRHPMATCFFTIRFGGLGLYFVVEASSYALVASRAQYWVLQDHIL